MFREKSPQSGLFEAGVMMPASKRRRLERSWAETFRRKALPLIDEAPFAPLYCRDNGRPNQPVQTVFGVLLLKEMFGLTDMEALEQLEFSLLWHHALAVSSDEAHLCQKTLHNFRARLLAHDKGRSAFEATTDRILRVLGTKVVRQRMDSTQVTSNMASLSRLGLFCETIRHFLKQLRAAYPELYAGVSDRLRDRYLKGDGGAASYEDARSSACVRRLSVCARDLYRLRTQFADTVAASLVAYGLLARLLTEQCEVVSEDRAPCREDDDAGEGGVPVSLKAVGRISGASLQSPHDPDATYSARKGKGYAVQLVETCAGEEAESDDAVASDPAQPRPVNVITHVEVTDACASDEHAAIPAIKALDARGQRPDELIADTAYGSGANALEAEGMDTVVIAPVKGPKAVAEKEPDAIDKTDFEIDARPGSQARCPAGQTPVFVEEDARNPRREVLTFARSVCASCALLARCPVRPDGRTGGYVVTVDRLAVHLARRRRDMETDAFQDRYRLRAGIEGAFSELKRRHGLGDLRVRGRPRVELAVHLKALACNLKRMVWAFAPENPGLAIKNP